MRRLIILSTLLLAAACLMPAVVHAIDFVQTGAVLTVTYTEPITNKDGSTLDDLGKTNVYFKVGAAAEVKGPDVAASKAAGGGNINTTITVPVAPDQQADVTVTATATDLSGNESARSPAITKRVDRLAPGAPK